MTLARAFLRSSEFKGPLLSTIDASLILDSRLFTRTRFPMLHMQSCESLSAPIPMH
jgi:hypothetical protein